MTHVACGLDKHINKEKITYEAKKKSSFLSWPFLIFELTYETRKLNSITCMVFPLVEALNGVK